MELQKPITIVIPAYNAEKTITETLDSLSLQTNKNFDVIVVHDGENQEQVSIVDMWGVNHDINIKNKIIKENKGVANARNVGLKLVTSPYVVFLDADDLLLPNAIQTFIAGIKQNADCIIGKTMRELKDGSFIVVGKEQITWIHGRCYKVDFLRKHHIDFPNLKMSEDLTFNSVIFELTNHILETQFPVHMHRNTIGSLSRSDYSEELQARTYIKSAIEYFKRVKGLKKTEELNLLPKFISMSYFYLDSVETFFSGETLKSIYSDMCKDFVELLDLIDYSELIGKDNWYDKLSRNLLSPVRAYNWNPTIPIMTFEERVVDALKTYKTSKR